MKLLLNLKRNIFDNDYVRWGVIPSFLVIFWIVSSLVINNSFSTLVMRADVTNLNVEPGKLLAGMKISGKFVSQEENLGIVMLHVNNYVKPNYDQEDVLNFYLKQVGSKEWYYVGQYRSGAFERYDFFPFGFPPLRDSKNKRYEFQLVSLYGNYTNAIQIDQKKPVVELAYKFGKSEILKSKSSFIIFTIQKFINSFTDVNFLLSSTIYLLPLLFYLLWQVGLFRVNVRSTFKYFHFWIIALIWCDILFLKIFYMGIFTGLVMLWIVTLYLKKLPSKVSFTIAFILLIIWLSLMTIRIPFHVQKLNIWAYTFLVIGSVQLIIEEKKAEKYEKV